MRRRMTVSALVGCALLTAACGSDEDGPTDAVPANTAPAADEEKHDHDEDRLPSDLDAAELDAPAYRIFVADGEAGRVTVVDVETGDELEEVEITAPQESPTMFATTEDGRYGFAVMYDRNDVQAIDAGVWTMDHGDHSHYYAAPVAALALYSGVSPSHVVAHGELTAIFYDGDGEYRVLTRADIAEGSAGTAIPVDAPHHGVAVPWSEDRFVVTEYGETNRDESTLPPNVVVHDAAGKVVQSDFPACPELHGEAASAEAVSFACEDGILVLEEHGDHFDGQKLEYPDDAGRAGTLRTTEELDVLVGNYSDDVMLVIDPGEHSVTPLEIPAAFSTFAVTGHDDGAVLGLSADGSLHVVNVSSGAATTIADVVQPYAEDAEWTEPTPQLAVGPGSAAYVSEPATGQVHEVDLGSGKVSRSLDVGGTPFHLAVMGR